MSVREQNRRNRILLGQDNNALTWLIIINAVMFVTLLFTKVIFQMSNGGDLQTFQTQIINWFALPGAADKVLSRPWTVISYMFSHDSIWYFISSLLWLWCFGYILQDLAGNTKLFPIYLYGGIAGAIAFLLAANCAAHSRMSVVFQAPRSRRRRRRQSDVSPLRPRRRLGNRASRLRPCVLTLPGDYHRCRCR